MRLIRTLSAGYRSLTDILEGLARKKCIIGAISLGAAVSATSAPAAPFLDNFNTDTSANYTFENSYGGGGSFDVSGGTLNITTGANNTAMASTTSAVPFAVGESLGVDTRSVSGPEGVFLTLGTTAGQPGAAGGDGYRWRRDTSGAGDDGVRLYAANGDGIFASGIDPDPLDPATLWIDRTAADTFDFYIQKIGAPGRTLIGTHTYAALSSVTNMHLGMQAFDGSTDDFPFDNLRIVDTDVLNNPPNLTLLVNSDTGQVTLSNDSGSEFIIDYYLVGSADSSLLTGDENWISLDDQNLDSVGGGEGESWDEGGGSDADELAELFLEGNSTLADGGFLPIGSAFNTAGLVSNLSFTFRTADTIVQTGDVVEVTGFGDMNGDGAIDSLDVNPMVQALTDRAAYEAAHPGVDADVVGDFNSNGKLDLGDLGAFKAAVPGVGSSSGAAAPEPSSMILLGWGVMALVGPRIRRSLGSR